MYIRFCFSDMRRTRRRCRRCHGFALFLVLVNVTVVGYNMLTLRQPLAQSVPSHHRSNALHPAPDFVLTTTTTVVGHFLPAIAVTDGPSLPTRHLPGSDLGLDSRSFCGGRLVAYGHQFALLRSAVVDRRYCRSERKGGEAMDTVINQPESVEYYRFVRGCFQIACASSDPSTTSGKLEYMFNVRNNHLNEWLRSVKLTNTDASVDNVDRLPRFTIAVTRYEYANLYHTMTDWYNAFLLLCFFNETSDSTDILFIDAHPSGSLDPVWRRLFRRTLRLSDLSPDRPTLFERLAWGWRGYDSPITIYPTSPKPPLFEEFRSFFLSTYGVPAASTLPGRPDCDAMRLSVVFIWRRDYVAHPRNPQGSVGRKIANEDELLRRVKLQLPQARVTGVQIDRFTMAEQLRIIADTDILIGESIHVVSIFKPCCRREAALCR